MSHLCTGISLCALYQLINVNIVCYGCLAEQYLKYLSSCCVIWQADVDLPVQSTWSLQRLSQLNRLHMTVLV